MSRQAPARRWESTRQHSRASGSAARSALGRVESRELFVRWQQDRDQAARDELVERFLPLARKLARRYTGAHEPFEDLLQVASYGLLKALDRFDPDRGNAFSSFAVPTIVGELKRYFRDLGWSAHVPRGAQELALKVQRAQEKLTTKTGRSPTVAELAQYLELSIEDVLEGLETAAAHHSSSLDAPHDDGDGESGTLADTFGQQDAGFQLVEDLTTVAAAMTNAPRTRAAGALSSLLRGPHAKRDRQADRSLTDADLADPATSDHNTDRTNAARKPRRKRPSACLTAPRYRQTSLSTLGAVPLVALELVPVVAS